MSSAPAGAGTGAAWLRGGLALVTAVDGRDEIAGTSPARLLTGRVVRGLGVLAPVVLLVADIAQLAQGEPDRAVYAWPAAAAHVGSLALAWRFPLTGWRVSFLVTVLTGVLLAAPSGVPWSPATLFAHLGALFLLAFCAGRPLIAAAVLVDAAVYVAGSLVVGARAEAVVAGPVVLLLVSGLGAALGAQRRTAQALAASRRGAAAEESRRAVLEERARIARDLHDVVAHHLSRIAVRAESAPVRVPDTGPGAAAELREIAGDARDALTDMRRLLGVLRTDDPSPTGPAPDLQGVDELVDAARRAGLAVDLTRTVADDAGDAVLPDVGLAGYRVVQEALSNAARHAPGAPVTVAVLHAADAVRIRVRNDPAPDAPAPAAGPGEVAGQEVAGQGLAGMGERVGAVGGTMRAAPDADGGWTVRVGIPLGGASGGPR